MIDAVPVTRPELSKTLQKVLRLAHEAIPFDKGAIHLLQGDALWVRAVWARPGVEVHAGIEGMKLALESGFCGFVAREGTPFVSQDVARETRLMPSHYQGANLQIRSFLGIPLCWEGAVIGVLEMDSLVPAFFQPHYVELAEVVADQAAIAIVNARLAEDHQRLGQIAQALNATLELEPVVNIVLDHLPNLLDFDSATISLLDGDTLDFVAVRGGDAPTQGERVPLAELALSRQVVQSGKPLLLADARQNEWSRAPHFNQNFTWLGAPLIANGEVIGVLSCDAARANSYGERELSILATCADQAALAIQNARLYSDTRSQNRALLESNHQLAALLDATDSGIIMSDGRGRVVHVNSLICRLFALPREELVGASVSTLIERIADAFSDPMAFRERADWLYAHPRAVARDNLATAGKMPRLFQRYSAPVYGSETGGERPGRIEVYNDVTESRKLEEQMRQYLDEMLTIQRVGVAMGSERELATLLRLICEQAGQLVGTNGAAVALLREENPETLLIPVVHGMDSSHEERIERLNFSVAGEAIQQRRPCIINDSSDPSELAILQQQWQMESSISVPLESRDRVIGALMVFSRQPRFFDEHDVQVLQIFAAQAAVTLENTRLLRVAQQRRKELEMLTYSLRQSRGNLNAILQSMADGVIALDNQERIIFVNQPLFDLFHIPQTDRKAWVNRPVAELWPHLGEIAPLLREAKGEMSGTFRVAVELRAPPRAVEVLHTPIVDNTGQHVGSLVLLHDITELRKNERMKDELLSVLSHELRTPLTSILGYSKLLADRPDSAVDKRTRWATHILDKSRLLNRLINEVLDLSRLNVQRFDLHLAPHDLGTLIHRIVDEQRVTTDIHELRTELEGDLTQIPIDADRIDQLLTNLLVNAIKYSPKGGIISLRGKRVGKWVEIEVEDKGMGIAPEFHDRIFEPFFRVDNSTTRDVYGTGLGLSLCRGIAKAHGGELTLRSEVDQGTTFFLRLPATV